MDRIVQWPGKDADSLLNHTCRVVPKKRLHLPGPDFVGRVHRVSDRNIRVLRKRQRIIGHGRLGGSGYLSVLPVGQGIEHSGRSAFAPNPDYVDPDNIVRLAIEGGCNAASTRGVLGSVARQYGHKIPFFVKINHDELLTYPNQHDRIFLPASNRCGIVPLSWGRQFLRPGRVTSAGPGDQRCLSPCA